MTKETKASGCDVSGVLTWVLKEHCIGAQHLTRNHLIKLPW